MRALVPIAAMVATYYLTNLTVGTALAQQFGLPPQLIPMVISVVVGGVSRQLMK